MELVVVEVAEQDHNGSIQYNGGNGGSGISCSSLSNRRSYRSAKASGGAISFYNGKTIHSLR